MQDRLTSPDQNIVSRTRAVKPVHFAAQYPSVSWAKAGGTLSLRDADKYLLRGAFSDHGPLAVPRAAFERMPCFIVRIGRQTRNGIHVSVGVFDPAAHKGFALIHQEAAQSGEGDLVQASLAGDVLQGSVPQIDACAAPNVITAENLPNGSVPLQVDPTCSDAENDVRFSEFWWAKGAVVAGSETEWLPAS